VIQWSWDHLLAPERDLMRRLAVFTGGWTLERATAVCSENGDEFEVLDLHTRLAERSLVVLHRAGDGGVRYGFLESVWRFALERLETDLEHAALRERHLATYLALAEQAEQAMAGPGLQQTVRELLPEEENILAALAWCAQAEDGVQRGLRLAAAVQRFWTTRGQYALGRRALEEALARDREQAPTPARALALTRAAAAALAMGDYDAARPHLEQSHASCRASGDRKGQARALAGLVVVAMWHSRFEEAMKLGEESLALYRELGERRGVAVALHNLGTIEWALRVPDHGRSRLEAALQMLRDSGDRGTEALCLTGLASTLVRVGDLDAALGRLREALALLEELGLPRESAFLLDALAEWLFAVGRPADAARVLGAGGAARLRLGSPLMLHERLEVERLKGKIVAQLGEGEASGCAAIGAAWSSEQAIAEAKALLNSVQPD